MAVSRVYRRRPRTTMARRLVLLLSVTWPATVVSSSAATTSAPWQDAATWDRLHHYQELPPTVFAPGGHLYSVDQVQMSVSSPDDPSSNLVVALTYGTSADDGGIVVVSTIPPPLGLWASELEWHNATMNGILEETNTTNEIRKKLVERRILKPLWWNDELEIDNDNVPTRPIISGMKLPFLSTTLHQSSKDCVVAITAGNAIHSQLLRRKVQRLADVIWQEHDDGLNNRRSTTSTSAATAGILARRLADVCQQPTQLTGRSAGRMLMAATVIVGEGTIWQVDPTGQFWNCHASIVGRAAENARAHLLELIEQHHNTTILHGNATTTDTSLEIHDPVQSYCRALSKEEALRAACQCIQKAHRIPFVVTSKETINNKQNPPSLPAAPPPRLLGLSLSTSDLQSVRSTTVQWHHQSELLRYLSTREASSNG